MSYIYPLCRVGDHQMTVKVAFGVLAQALNYGGSQGEIGHKVAILQNEIFSASFKWWNLQQPVLGSQVQLTMTSTCSQSAPSLSILSHSSASLAKSELRMDGDISV